MPPRITYGAKTVDLPEQAYSIEVQQGPPRIVNQTITGKHEVITTPRIETSVRLEWPMMDSASARRQLENFNQAALRGERWTLALDTSKTVNTTIVVDASDGATTIYVDDPVGISVSGNYKLIDGPNYQLVTVSAISGDRITISEALDFDVSAGAIFRDEYYFVGLITDSRSPIRLRAAMGSNAGQITGTGSLPRFDFKLEFIEDVSQEDTVLFKNLSGDAAGTDTASAQDWFPSSGDVTVASDTTYEFEGYLRTSRAAGTTSHTTSLLFAGTATLASIAYNAITNTGDTVANAARNGVNAEVATATVIKAASTSATEQIATWVRGTVRVTTGGTFIPQFQYSAAPGGAPSVLKNTFFKLTPIGSATVTSQGTWS